MSDQENQPQPSGSDNSNNKGNNNDPPPYSQTPTDAIISHDELPFGSISQISSQTLASTLAVPSNENLPSSSRPSSSRYSEQHTAVDPDAIGPAPKDETAINGTQNTTGTSETSEAAVSSHHGMTMEDARERLDRYQQDGLIPVHIRQIDEDRTAVFTLGQPALEMDYSESRTEGNDP